MQNCFNFLSKTNLLNIFVIIQNKLIGMKLLKGIKYGVFFCVITFSYISNHYPQQPHYHLKI